LPPVQKRENPWKHWFVTDVTDVTGQIPPWGGEKPDGECLAELRPVDGKKKVITALGI